METDVRTLKMQASTAIYHKHGVSSKDTNFPEVSSREAASIYKVLGVKIIPVNKRGVYDIPWPPPR